MPSQGRSCWSETTASRRCGCRGTCQGAEVSQWSSCPQVRFGCDSLAVGSPAPGPGLGRALRRRDLGVLPGRGSGAVPDLTSAEWPGERVGRGRFVVGGEGALPAVVEFPPFALGLPPQGTKVWLGTVTDADPAREQAVVRAVPELVGHPAHPRQQKMVPQGASCDVWSFGHLLVGWCRVPGPPQRPQSDGERWFRRCERVGIFTRVWPPQRTVTHWPTQLPLDKTT